MATRVRSFAKINLGLAIGPSRQDGFHALATVYQTIGLHDFVTVAAKPAAATSLKLTSTHARVPTDERNTAWRMVAAALEAMDVSARVTIHIEKQLPIQGGLGAGSANAAAALIALEAELSPLLKNDALPGPERLRIAAQIGSDVPLFLIGGTVLGLGRGEQVYPLPDLPPSGTTVACVIAVPDVGVSTPQAFRDWDALHTGPAFGLSLVRSKPVSHEIRPLNAVNTRDSLTEQHPVDTLEGLSRAVAGVWSGPYSSGVSTFPQGQSGDLAGNPLSALVRTGIENDFEEVVFPQHPFLGDIKRILADSVHPDEQAIYASLSGSGASLFGLYGTEGAAAAAQQRLAEKRIPGFSTGLLTRERYWRDMFLDQDERHQIS